MDFTHALGASCNVFFYEAGSQLGADGIAKWARALGLGAPTGFDVAGEGSGVIPDAAWHDKHIPGGAIGEDPSAFHQYDTLDLWNEVRKMVRHHNDSNAGLGEFPQNQPQFVLSSKIEGH